MFPKRDALPLLDGHQTGNNVEHGIHVKYVTGTHGIALDEVPMCFGVQCMDEGR